MLRHESPEETTTFLPARATASESDAHIYYHSSRFGPRQIVVSKKTKMSNTQETERINEQGEVERTVETVDYRAPAGKEEPSKEKVGVVHLVRDKDAPRSLTGAATAVADTARSAKDALLGKTKDGAAE